MANKAPDAFRTISEVSGWLDTPAHVLRFWESKFSQIKPVKRAGGRRYYRPDDMALLAGIKHLLHEQGMTIKGAQKLLREQGVKQVAALSPPIDGYDFAVPEAAPETKSVDLAAGPIADSASASETAPAADTPAAPQPSALDAPQDTGPDAVVVDMPTAAPQAQPTATPDAEPPIAAGLQEPRPDPEPVNDAMAPASPAGAPQPAADSPAMAMPPPTLPRVVEARAVTAPKPDLPPPPAPRDDLGPRMLGLLRNADPARLRARADEIAPLVARLEALQDRMHAG